MKRSSLLLIGVLASAGIAQAAAFDDYQECWSAVAVRHLDMNGISEKTVDAAMRLADKTCAHQRKAAIKAEGKETVEDMRDYMAVQFVNANGRDL